jgi:gliding motility-associated protein GldM
MAGGKETPRQKMIGMMYLVLTALLALQVSNAVLEKFAIINETLGAMISNGDAANQRALDGLLEGASENQEAKVKAAVDNAKAVRALTKSTMASIEELKKKMLKVSGADEVNNNVINDHSSKVATMMIDVNSPDGKNYEKLLNTYVSELNKYTGGKGNAGKPFEEIAKAPKDMPLFKADDDHSRKSFLEFTFENTPVIAALASVTQVETEILEYEAAALTTLQQAADVNVIKFDQFIPMVRPNASVVAAGAKYTAEMFLTGSSTAINPEFYLDGKTLSVIEDPETKVKMGKVEFTASGGGYDDKGMAKKSFLAKIKMNDKTFEKKIEYYVAQPVIRVTTGNAPTLYMNCGNTVNIEVPALGSAYNPSFSSTGAEIRKGDKPGRVTIIPKQRKITVAVSNGGTSIGTQGFDVKNIPPPRYIAYIGNQPVDLRNGVRANQLPNLRFAAEPDANFKEEVPKDARYQIKRAEVILGRGTTGVQRLNATNGNPDLRSWVTQARPGDRIVIDIKDVSRRTYTDTEEKVDVAGSAGIIQFPIL